MVRSGGDASMKIADPFLYVVLPYAAIVLLVAGHIWRYHFDKLG
jgi:nitrate reductase gamma subunit